MADDNMAWHEETSAELADAAASTFTYTWMPTNRPRLIRLHGPCPRCGHPFTYEWPVDVVREVTATTPEPVTVYCGCRHHPGAPPNTVGCGAYWDLDIPRPGPGTVR